MQTSARKRGHWTIEEDIRLLQAVKRYGEGRWSRLAKAAELQRCGKSCRLRWVNYLRPDVKRGNISEEEERLIIQLHAAFGNKWSLIAVHLPGRSDNEIKNYWRSQIQKRIQSTGPVVKNGNEKSAESQSFLTEGKTRIYEHENDFISSCGEADEYRVGIEPPAWCTSLYTGGHDCTTKITPDASEQLPRLQSAPPSKEQERWSASTAFDTKLQKKISDFGDAWTTTYNQQSPLHLQHESQSEDLLALKGSVPDDPRDHSNNHLSPGAAHLVPSLIHDPTMYLLTDGDITWDVESIQPIADSYGTPLITDDSWLWAVDLFDA